MKRTSKPWPVKDLERLRRRRRRKQNIIRAFTVQTFVWAGVAVLYYVGFSLFFDTPVEYELKHSTDRLRSEYEALFGALRHATRRARQCRARDRNVFGILFESTPYDFDSERDNEGARLEQTADAAPRGSSSANSATGSTTWSARSPI